MSQPLISTEDLISQSWYQFKATWKETIQISMWFLAPPIILFIGIGLAILSPALGGLWLGIANLLSTLVALYVTMRLIKFLLDKDRDANITPASTMLPMRSLVSYIWIAFLIVIATFVGLILFIVPAIWLGVALSMALLIFMEDGVKGIKALSASMALIKGRWWSTFWRQICAGFVFGALILLAVAAIYFIVGLIAGFGKVGTILGMNAADASSQAFLLSSAFQSLIQAVIQVAFASLLITWQVKLFHSLKATR